MTIMSQEEALTAVLKDIEAMSVEELRAEHEANKGGDIAVALRELRSDSSADATDLRQPDTVSRAALQSHDTPSH